MSAASSGFASPSVPTIAPVENRINRETDDFLARLPRPERLSADQRRGIIARYTAVLEGNFIYWMTGAYLAVTSDPARAIILDNLQEEVRDAHPLMLRKFAIAARAVPTDSDALAINRDLTQVRLFIGRLSPLPIVVMMTFFEGLIRRFMPYLADLAERQGSTELQYTDVHGECDIAHTEGLYRVVEAELEAADNPPVTDELFEGVTLLRRLLETTITGHEAHAQ